MEKVRNFDNVSELGTEVPYLIFSADYSPDFKNHCKKTLDSLRNQLNHKEIKRIKSNFESSDQKEFRQFYPNTIALGLADGGSFYLKLFFTHFVVCRFSEFPALIQKIKGIADQTAETSEER